MRKGTKVITGKVRLSYVHLFKPHAAVEGQEPQYSVTILIPKDDEKTLGEIRAAMKEAAEDGKAKFGGKIPANLRTTLRDGDEEKPDQEEYQGHMFMNLRSKTAPGIIDRYKNKIEDSSEVYSGCYARVSLNCYAYNVSGNRGISAGLNNVQKVAEGEFLGGRSKATDDFDEWEEDDEFGDDDLLG